MENFRVATNSFLHKGEGEIRYQHFDQPGGQSNVLAEIRTKPILPTDEKEKNMIGKKNCMEGRH